MDIFFFLQNDAYLRTRSYAPGYAFSLIIKQFKKELYKRTIMERLKNSLTGYQSYTYDRKSSIILRSLREYFREGASPS